MDEYTTARECYETETEIIVIGGVKSDDESHNCNEMGCGSATPHVKYRIKKSELAAIRSRADDAGRVERDDRWVSEIEKAKAQLFKAKQVIVSRATIRRIDFALEWLDAVSSAVLAAADGEVK